MDSKIKKLGYLLWTGIGVISIFVISVPNFSDLHLLLRILFLVTCVAYFCAIGFWCKMSSERNSIPFYEAKTRLIFHPAAVLVVLLVTLAIYINGA